MMDCDYRNKNTIEKRELGDMKKIIIVVMVIVVLIAGIGGGLYFLSGLLSHANEEGEVLQAGQVGAILEQSRLTQEEKTLTGIWQSEEGYILAVRERSLSSTEFALDAIIYAPSYDQWFKVTREDGSFVNSTGGEIELGDYHDCPASDDEYANYVETKEELLYEESTDTIKYTSYVGGESIVWPTESGYVETIVFHRTDLSISEAEEGWDWYYEIEEGRDPR